MCGCGVPDADTESAASCVPLKAALIHRYTFGGSGTSATDSVGTAHGALVNAALSNMGALTLAGAMSDQFVDLPNGIISSLTDATLEAWFTWNGGSAWQRLFDFGTSGTEGSQGTGTSYLFFTPQSVPSESKMRLTFSTGGLASEVVAVGPSVLGSGAPSHVTVVVNDREDLLALYVDGALVASQVFVDHLSGISDVNNWLGRSQYSGDPNLGGMLTEFRIYAAALSAKQIVLTHLSGPDPLYF